MSSSLCSRCSGELPLHGNLNRYTTSWTPPAMPMIIPNIYPDMSTNFQGTLAGAAGISLWPAEYSPTATNPSPAPGSDSMRFSTPDLRSCGPFTSIFAMKTDNIVLQDGQLMPARHDTTAVEMTSPIDSGALGLQTPPSPADYSTITTIGPDMFTPFISPLNYLVPQSSLNSSMAVAQRAPPIKPGTTYPCSEPGCKKAFSKIGSLKYVHPSFRFPTHPPLT